MAKNRRNRQPTSAQPLAIVPAAELNTEFANRLRDPFEQNYMGVLRTNDPLLLERGNGGVELYRDLRRDGKVFSGLQKRQLSLIGKAWQVEPRAKDNAKATQDAETLTTILKGFAFDKLCADLLEALLAGHAIAEIIWTIRDDLVVPARVVKRAQRRFVYVQDDEHSPPRLQLLTRENMLTGLPVPERKFIVHRVNPEDDNPTALAWACSSSGPCSSSARVSSPGTSCATASARPRRMASTLARPARRKRARWPTRCEP